MTTTKQIKEWVNLYQNQHLTATRIAEMYGVSRWTITHNLRQFGVKLKTGHPRLENGYYTICIYDKNDNLLWLFESIGEMSKTLGIRYNTVESAICRLKQGTKKYITIKHKYYKIELIGGVNENESNKN